MTFKSGLVFVIQCAENFLKIMFVLFHVNGMARVSGVARSLSANQSFVGNDIAVFGLTPDNAGPDDTHT